MKVFISWSKKYSGEIAKKLKKWLESAFSNNINIFISQGGIPPGTSSYQKISEELSGSDIGILVLTPENINAPWLMYEAGALSTTTMQAQAIPILFGRAEAEIEAPIREKQYLRYKKEDFSSLLDDINRKIGARNSEDVLKCYLHGTWDVLEKEITPLVEKAKIALPTIGREGLKTTKQDGVDLSVQRVFSVKYQTSIDVSVDKVFPGIDLQVKDIPPRLAEFARENFSSDYLLEETLGSGDEGTRVMINRTRVSTFISFTDGARIAFFDRRSSSKKTKTVTNDALDVFGAVHFGNGRMLKVKIKNENFHDVKVEGIEEIPGFAFEDNESDDLEKETAIMFGYSVKVSPNDLEKIESTEGDSRIYLKDISNGIPKSVTAKAELACKFIQRKNRESSNRISGREKNGT